MLGLPSAYYFLGYAVIISGRRYVPAGAARQGAVIVWLLFSLEQLLAIGLGLSTSRLSSVTWAP